MIVFSLIYKKSKMMISEPWCNYYQNEIEDALHVLRDCPSANALWCKLLNPTRSGNFFY